MRPPRSYLTLLVGLVLVCLAPAAEQEVQPQAVQPPAPRWKLVWADEFDGKELDKTKWGFDTSNGFFDYDANQWTSGWGNDDLQYYTSRPENAFVKDGLLHIRALKEAHRGYGYTSARLKT